MLKKAEETFEHVIILINSSHVMELGFLDDENVDAAVWIGGIGDVGSLSVAGVLSGRIDPSGRTVDTYPYQMNLFRRITISESMLIRILRIVLTEKMMNPRRRSSLSIRKGFMWDTAIMRQGISILM